MSSESHTMELVVDAAGAKSGADAFATAMQKIVTATENMDQRATAALTKLRSGIAGTDFSKLAKDVAALGSVRIDPSLARNISSLTMALGGLSTRMPTAQQSASLHAFASAMNNFRAPNINSGSIAALSAAVRNFRAPTALQTANFDAFIRSLNATRINTNINQIVTALDRITLAARNARTAMSGIGTANINVPPGLRGRGPMQQPYIPTVNRGYGPRNGPGPYDGVFSGNTRATGELRGFENMVNPSFQAASIVRTMIPAITTGEGMKALYEEGAALISFQHTLESVTNTTADATENQHRLAESMQFATTVAQKYGLNLGTLREQWARFAVTANAAGFSDATSKKMFDDLAQGMRARGLTNQQIQSVLNAADQAMSTGHFNMMQMHREMGLVIPAVKIMADALGISTEKVEELSKKSQLGAGALRLFAAQMAKFYGPGLETAVASPQSALERLKTQWLLTLDTMNDNGTWATMGEQFDRFANLLRRDDVIEMFKRLARGLADGMKMMGDGVVWVADHMDTLILVFKAFIVLGAYEAITRIGGAFAHVGELALGIVAPITKATAAVKGFMAAQGVTAGASAAQAGMAGVAGGAAGAGLGMGLGFGAAAGATRGANAAANAAANFASSAAGQINAAYAPQIANGWTAAQAAAAGAAAQQAATKTGLLATAWEAVQKVAVGGIQAILGLMNPWVTAIGAVTAAFYLGRDAIVSTGEYGKITASDIIKEWGSEVWNAVMKGGSGAFSALESMWDAISGAISHAMEWFAKNALSVVSTIVNAVHTAASYIANAGGLVGEYTVYSDSAGNGVMAQATKEIEARQKAAAAAVNARTADANSARRDRRDTETYTPPATEPPIYLPGNEHAHHGKSEAEKATDALDALLKQMNPGSAIIEKYAEEIETLNRAIKAGVHSKGAEMVAANMRKHGDTAGADAYLADEYARTKQGIEDQMREAAGAMTPFEHALKDLHKQEQILDALVKSGLATQEEATDAMKRNKDAVLEALGAVTPYEKALNDLNKKQRDLNDAVKAGLIDQTRAAQVMKEAVHAHAEILNPIGEENRKINEQIQLLGLGNKEREAEAAVVSMRDKMIKEGIPVNEQALNQLRENVKLLQAAKQNASDREPGIQSWDNSVRPLDTELAKFEQSLPNTMVDAWAKWVTTGKSSIMDVAKTLEAELLKIFMKQGIKELMQALGLTTQDGDSKGGSYLGALLGVSHDYKNNGGTPAASAQTSVKAIVRPDGSLSVYVVNHDLGVPVGAPQDGGRGGWGAGAPPVAGGSGASAPNGGAPASSNMVFNADGSWSGRTTQTAGNSAAQDQTGGSTVSGVASAVSQGAGIARSIVGQGGVGSGILGSIGQLANVIANPNAANSGIPGLLQKGYNWLFGNGSSTSNAPKDFSTMLGSGSSGGSSASGGAGGVAQQSGGLLSSLGSWIGNGLSSLFGGGAASSAGAAAGGWSAAVAEPAAAWADAPMAVPLAADFYSEGGYSGQAVSKGMVPATAWAHAPHYAEGTTNTSGGMPSVLHPDEAVIPLSRGRKIPVDMGKNGGQVSHNVTFNVTTPDADSFNNSTSQIHSKLASTIMRKM